jgi:phage tail-like protein
MAEEFRVATAFRFRVTLSPSPVPPDDRGTRPAARPPAADPPPAGPLADGGFQECTGLDLEMDVGEYVEGGRNNGVIQRAGRMKVARLTLRRGMLHPVDGAVRTELWQWFQDVVDGVRPLRRYDGTVDLLGAPRPGQLEPAVLARWTFSRGLPARIVGPQLNARTGEIAVEELQIAHERLRLEVV